MRRRLVWCGLGLVGTLLFVTPAASAQDCTGNCGSSNAADGVVTLPPGGSSYGWVSSFNGVSMNGLGLGGETNGSTFLSALFGGNAGDLLSFQFNYVTSDGAGFADYAWVQLLDDLFTPVALLFTARTHPTDPIVPGSGLPAPEATLNPSPVTIVAGGPSWSELGPSSGQCFSDGCGYSGWVQSTYNLGAAGSYYLLFGVVNWSDTAFDSGLAFAGLTIGDVIIGDPGTPGGGGGDTVVPEPSTIALLATGLVGLGGAGFIRRRRRQS